MQVLHNVVVVNSQLLRLPIKSLSLGSELAAHSNPKVANNPWK